MNKLKRIRKLWFDFQKMPFPENLVRKDINNVCFISLDSIVAGCIDTYSRNGRLDKNRIRILESCLEDLDSIIHFLEGYSKDYFLVLKKMCIEIITDSK